MATELEPNAAPKLRTIPQPDAEDRYQSLGYRAKRLLLGPPFKTTQLVHERISKRVALAVFSSDPISSTAYATEEILLVLVFAGAAAIGLALPISVAIAGLLGILVLSYRQIIKAYSSSGGAYVVSRDNFGGLVASIAGSALIIDYILTVAVSVSAGTAALTSAFHVLEPWRVVIAVRFVVLLAWGNLRGLAESGRPFADGNPTLVAQLARHVLDNPAAFIAIQVATLLILVLAANTSFSSFPLLASFAADDAILPRQLRKRGHRLVYSNGILVLSAAAIFLVIAFRADTHHLIPLYAIGVVTSFTLSQAGMARRHLRLREPGWRQGLLITAAGATVTPVALAPAQPAPGVWGAAGGPRPGAPGRAAVRPPAQPTDGHRPARRGRPRP